MPFDIGDFSGASSSDRAASRRSRRAVAGWLFVLAAMILVMIGLGGATRLTGSGLSIMEWAPLSGALPPLSDAEWHRLFNLYQQIPQYALINQGFSLEDFKGIFWLEWIHRQWGRLLGLAFAGPLIWFWVTGRIERRLIPRLILVLALGGLQGAVGWFMVASGFFPDATTVSPYRLVVHLSLALILYSVILWTALSTLHPRVAAASGDTRLLRICAMIMTVLIASTIAAGGFVAGTRAGLTYNTFPLMDGTLVPDGYFGPLPFLRNLAENVAAVQFNHRLLASATLLGTIITLIVGLRHPASVVQRVPLIGLVLAVGLQYALGVTTLLLVVPVGFGTAHQVCAVLALTSALVLLHTLPPNRRAPRRP
ncbi:MAG: COX15/CtaA family protein [Acetobacteraceae bacterium]